MQSTREVIDTSQKKLELKTKRRLQQLLDDLLREREALALGSPDYALSQEAENRLIGALKVVREREASQAIGMGM